METIYGSVRISVLSILRPANSVTNNTPVKLHISFVIDGMTIKAMLESLTGKSLVCRGFLNKASVTFIDKTNGKDPKKREICWIQTLETMESYGLNIPDSV